MWPISLTSRGTVQLSTAAFEASEAPSATCVRSSGVRRARLGALRSRSARRDAPAVRAAHRNARAPPAASLALACGPLSQSGRPLRARDAFRVAHVRCVLPRVPAISAHQLSEGYVAAFGREERLKTQQCSSKLSSKLRTLVHKLKAIWLLLHISEIVKFNILLLFYTLTCF